MTELKLLDLFAGKGTFYSSLKQCGIDVKLVGFSEIDPSAITAYKGIHNLDDSFHLGDVREVKNMNLEVDIITSGSPCQDFTNEGKGLGANKGSGTRSSLLWEQVEIAKKSKPKVIIWENVRGVTFKKNAHILEQYITDLETVGYNTYYKLLNAYDYNSVQKRIRLFVVSIRKDIDDGNFEFPNPIHNNSSMISKLEQNVGSKYDVPKKVYDELILEELTNGKFKVKNATTLGYLIAEEGDCIDFTFPTSKTRRGRVQKNACQTVKTSSGIGVVQNGKVRYLTPLEYWRVQEYSDEWYYKAVELGLTEDQLYSIAGNAINLKCLNALIEQVKSYLNSDT